MKTKKIYTNSTEDIQSAIQLLKGSGLSILDCARLIRNTIDFKPIKSKINNVQYCTKVINSGIKHLHIKEMKISKGFIEYLESKKHLRKSSFNDIKYIGKRLFKNKEFANLNFSELTIAKCQKWLNETYPTSSQYNKAHTMLNGLFNFALRQEWADRNVVKLVQKRKVIEAEIKALSLPQAKALIKSSQLPKFSECKAGVALMLWAGIRPQELQRLTWQDIDLDENIITIRPSTSKTGGARHIEIPKVLKQCLKSCFDKLLSADAHQYLIVPHNWQNKWKALRKHAGFLTWTQDVLRHTYASYHAKFFQNLQRLQLNMGHSNLHLLRTRYINLRDISKLDAKNYFSIAS